jgi:sucrose phosphorylase
MQRPELHDVFSLFYILSTFFQSDLDRGFSINRYELNEDFVSEKRSQGRNILSTIQIIPQFPHLPPNG